MLHMNHTEFLHYFITAHYPAPNVEVNWISNKISFIAFLSLVSTQEHPQIHFSRSFNNEFDSKLRSLFA